MAQPRSGPKSFKEPAPRKASVARKRPAAPRSEPEAVVTPPTAQDAARPSALILSPRQKERIVRDMLQGQNVEDLPDFRLQIFAKALGATDLPEVGGRQERRDKTLALVKAALGKYEEEQQGLRDARAVWSTPAPEPETPTDNGE